MGCHPSRTTQTADMKHTLACYTEQLQAVVALECVLLT
jgi:hypothetical protein